MNKLKEIKTSSFVPQDKYGVITDDSSIKQQIR